jgi:tetratricopeptide (TPR) repeat protein
MTTLRLLPLLLLVGCATHSVIDESTHYANLGDYGRAYYVLDELHREQTRNGGTANASLEKAWHEARLAWLMYHAEQQLFGDNESGTLATLVELETLAPAYPGIEGLRDRAHLKLAKRMLHKAEESFNRKEYVQALASFLECESIVPGMKDTADGIKDVWDAMERMSKRAQDQFLEAVRKLPELRYVEVQWHANNVRHNDPNREEAKQIEMKARSENALASMSRGKDCERAGRYGAALIEYRIAKLFDAGTPGVDDAIAAMRREQQAAVLVDKASIAMRAGRFDDARKALGEAFELSLMARNDIGALQLQTHKLESQRRYQNGRDLEVLGKKSEAVVAYEDLDKDWPDGFSDEKARIESLKVDIDGAAAEWRDAEAAEAAGDLPNALEHYIGSERYYAGWKDGKARIARLREAIAKAAGGTQGGG